MFLFFIEEIMPKTVDYVSGYAPRRKRLIRTWETGTDRCTVRPYTFKETWYVSLTYGSAQPPHGPNSFWDVDGGEAGTAWPRLGSNIPFATLENRVYEKLRSSAYESLQIGVDLFEGRQTLALLGNALNFVRRPIYTMGQALRRHAHRSKSAWHMPIHQFADVWLPFVYGVKPTMETIFSLTDMLGRTPRQRVRLSEIATATNSVSSSTKSPPTTLVVESRGLVRAGFTIDVVNPNVLRADELGLLNPLSFAWEVVPYSFVVDWFIPVGTMLRQLTDYAGCSITDGYTTYLERSLVTSVYLSSQTTRVTGGAYCRRMARAPAFTLRGVDLRLTQSVPRLLNAIGLLGKYLPSRSH